MLGYCAQGINYGGTVLLGGGLRSPSAFLVFIVFAKQLPPSRPCSNIRSAYTHNLRFRKKKKLQPSDEKKKKKENTCVS